MKDGKLEKCGRGRNRGKEARKEDRNRKKRRWNFGNLILMKEVYNIELGKENHRRKGAKWKSAQRE
jgi:hypothetical protein